MSSYTSTDAIERSTNANPLTVRPQRSSHVGRRHLNWAISARMRHFFSKLTAKLFTTLSCRVRCGGVFMYCRDLKEIDTGK